MVGVTTTLGTILKGHSIEKGEGRGAREGSWSKQLCEVRLLRVLRWRYTAQSYTVYFKN